MVIRNHISIDIILITELTWQKVSSYNSVQFPMHLYARAYFILIKYAHALAGIWA